MWVFHPLLVTTTNKLEFPLQPFSDENKYHNMKCDLWQQETTDGNDNINFETTDSIRSIKTLKLMHGDD